MTRPSHAPEDLSPAETAERLARWLAARRGAAVQVERLSRFDGGVSNLTYHVTLRGGENLVLRLQRRHGIFQPYDVLREARVLQGLVPLAIPVPEVLAVEPDRSALGAPFFLMEYVHGRHLGEVQGTPEEMASMFRQYVEAVVTIHRAPWERTLGFLYEPGVDPVERDLRAIEGRSRDFGCFEDPFLMGLATRLRTHSPQRGPTALCQGDVNVFNYLYRDGRLVAVVDWEQACIGDKRMDLGLIAALSMLKMGRPLPPSDAPIVRMYEEAASERLLDLEYFVSLAIYKLAVIYHGWRRYNRSEPWFGWDDLRAVAEAMEPATTSD